MKTRRLSFDDTLPPARRARWPAFWRGLAAVLAACVLITAALAALCWQVLAAQPGEWSRELRIGPLRHRVSLPVLIRLATHPMGLRLLDGRRLQTASGVVAFRTDADGRTLHASCAPCVLRLAALGEAPLRVEQAHWTITRRMPDDFRGTLLLAGPQGAALRADWHARLVAGGVQLEMSLPPAPVRDYYAVLASDLPELRRARIAGVAGFSLKGDWPAGRFELRPQVDGLAVDGLGTEALRTARFDSACPVPRAPADEQALDEATTRAFGRWLPRAVVSAEDQRFYEHTGYDLGEVLHAWSANQARDGQRPAGASTLSQQLAKLLFTGDERSWRRKLRELLWAVELDRTLGKARVLQAYLAIAPWGEGQCGAQAAARHYLNKPAAELTPLEAAWLAGMLRSPDAQARQWRQAKAVDARRVAQVVNGMRPMPRAARERLMAQAPAWQPQPRVAAERTRGIAGTHPPAQLAGGGRKGSGAGPPQAGSIPTGDRLTYSSGEGLHDFSGKAQVVPGHRLVDRVAQ